MPSSSSCLVDVLALGAEVDAGSELILAGKDVLRSSAVN